MDNLNKKSLLVISFLILVVAILFGAYQYYLQNKINNLPANNEEKNNRDLTEKMPTCPADWEKYRNDAIGINFCYPKEWGQPSTDPVKKVTRLSSLEKDLGRSRINYKNEFDIVFEKNSYMHLKLFNDQYGGDSEPSTYYGSGATGDVINLRSSGDICEYKIGYDYRYNPEMEADTLKTIYSDCSGGVKTVLTENKEIFDFDNIGTLYTYDLRLLFFTRLQNGYFDNVLVSREIDDANQIHEQVATPDEFFHKKKTTQVDEGFPTKDGKQLEQESNEFRQFVGSIASYKPIPKVQSEFEEIVGEDPDVTAIRKFYWLIDSEKLFEAYAMRPGNDDITFEKFQERYGNAYATRAYEFEKRALHQYRFLVDYQDHNLVPEKYRVEIKVSGGKLTTISLEKIIDEIITFGDMKAFGEQAEGYNYMILSKGDDEVVVDKAEEWNDEKFNAGSSLFFSSPKFSPRGNYLTYTASGYEWASTRVYDTKNETLISQVFSVDPYGFTDNDEYFYDCEANDFDGDYHGRVYSTPDFGVEYELLLNEKAPEPYGIGCEYDKSKKVIRFIVTNENGSDHQGTRIVEYSLVTNKAEEK